MEKSPTQEAMEKPPPKRVSTVMTDEIEGTSRLFHLNWLLFFIIITVMTDDISMVVRKRKAESEFLEKEKEESVCSNNLFLEMSGPGNRDDFSLSYEELNLFKAIFLDLSTGNRWLDKNPYLDYRWLEILDVYNERAVPMNLPEQTSIDIVLRAGARLHSTFRQERARYEIRSDFLAGVGRSNPRSLPPRDDNLLRIFEPCPSCKRKVLIFPTSLLTVANLSTSPLENPLQKMEIKLFIDLCVGVSKGSFLAEKNLWSRLTWIEFAETYSERAQALGFHERTWSEMVKAGREFQSEFCKQRKDQKHGLIEEVDVDLQQIFGFCDSCNKKIPIFPKILDSRSSLPSGSRDHTHVSGSRAPSHVGGSRARYCVNGGTRSVRQRSGSTHSDGEQVSTAERMSKAVEVLDLMYQREHIDFLDLYKLIGYSTTDNGFLLFLASALSFEVKVNRIPCMLPGVPNHVICKDPTDSDTLEALYTIESMAMENLIPIETYGPLVSLAGKDTVLVKYLISSVSLERKSEMMANFINDG